MKFKSFCHHFSFPRIGRYLVACDHNRKRCMELYQSNLKVAQAFHPLIGSLEVIIRNSIHHQLSSFFSDSDWIINQKSGFMSHSSLTYTCKKAGKTITNSYFLKSVTEAEQKLTKKGINITSSKIISEQTFGFWTDFFESHHYKILRGRPIKYSNIYHEGMAGLKF